MSGESNSDSSPRDAILRLRAEIGKVVVGQDAALSGLIVALLAPGHVLLEGVPGVAKTLLVKSLAASMDMSFKRLQFTPDLMPSDVTGQMVYVSGSETFEFKHGPIFANVVLADEINRTPAKTQAALLEAMEEHHVTIAGDEYALPEPFYVIATQNPVEYEGTYPLPEAQLDRFLFKLSVGYPSAEHERAVLARHQSGMDPHDLATTGVTAVASPGDLQLARRSVTSVAVEDKVQDYIVGLARATRDSPSLDLGVSPRGSTMLMHSAKAWAWLSGRDFVTPDDVKVMIKPCWRHRILVRPDIQLEGASADGILDAVMAIVPVPR